MTEKTVCKKCGAAGARSLIPYKIIEDKDGESIRFVGQLCDRCFKEIFGPPQNTKGEDDKGSEV